VRKTFIEFFEKKKKHTFVQSCPVVPHNDPTLLFINSGMAQFKPVFVGQIDPSHPFAKLKRACNSQKCIRAGGKHNDLDDVGKDVYHHTFFEMLGNWSFGDYFKKEAIAWSWELLTEVYKIDPSRIYATYYGGDPKQPNVPADEEAREIWKQYLPESRILPFDMKDNFWEMGDTGPCGPCSEIHYDRIGGRDAAHLVNMDDPDVLEIWNNVFMQYNRENDRSLTELPAKCVDTGMGFERVLSVLMDKRSNYDTDVFTKIFEAIQRETGARPYTGKLGAEDPELIDMAYRVVADHIRTLTIAITDGAMPSGTDRGYVLRRILRRAVRYGREKLNGKPGFFHPLVDSVLETLGDAFPTLRQSPEDVKAIIKEEEEQFGRTLDKGIKEFTKRAKDGKLSGEDCFVLCTSYGFPIDLTELMAEEKGVQIDKEAFDAQMEEFRRKSVKKKGGIAKDMQLRQAQTDALQNSMKVAVTDESSKYDWDTKGDGGAFTAKVMAIYDGKEFIQTGNSSIDGVGLVLDKTPCYAEQGGQIFDTATITTASGAEFLCEDAQKYAGYVIHVGNIQSGDLKVGDDVSVKVDYTRRALIAKNHTATHVLNYALRKVLGGKVDQKGSMVDEYKLRFDFSHNKPIEPEELIQIEKIVNEEIQKACPVYTKVVPLDLAKPNEDGSKGINGLRAIFNEQYPDPVRVVSVGHDVDKLVTDKSQPWGHMGSIEFCGGTHVANTGEIYKFVLQMEEGTAKGVRRLVAVTGPQAAVEATLRTKTLSLEVDEAKTLAGALLDKKIGELRFKITEDKEVSLILKKEMLSSIDGLKVKLLKSGKEATKAAEKKAKEVGEKIAEEASSAAGNKFAGVVDAGDGLDDGKAVTAAMEVVLKKCPGKAFLLLSSSAGKLALLCNVPKDLGDAVSAKAWAEAVLGAVDGKGGGNDQRYQGQHPDASKLDAALAAAKAFEGAAPAKGKAPAAGKGDKKAAEKGKQEAAPDADADRKAKLKKVVKEGGKRGVEIEGSADMGGLQFFCCSVDTPEGDTDLLVESMKAMNVECDPTEEERKGGSGKIGKMIFSAGAEQLAVVAYVPEAKQAELSCAEWIQAVVGAQGGEVLSTAKDVCVGRVKADSDKGVFPLKIREPMILEANNFLRKKGLFPEDDGDDDDEEYVYGDDDFPSM